VPRAAHGARHGFGVARAQHVRNAAEHAPE
jgi:hypothetical protein